MVSRYYSSCLRPPPFTVTGLLIRLQNSGLAQVVADELAVLQCLDRWLVALIIGLVGAFLTEIMSSMAIQYIFNPIAIDLVIANLYLETRIIFLTLGWTNSRGSSSSSKLKFQI